MLFGTHAQEFLNEHGAGAVPDISALMLVEAYATFKLNRKRSPRRLRLRPIRHLSRFGIKLLASSVQTFDGCSAIRREGLFPRASALLEPAVLKVCEPGAGEHEAWPELYTFNRRTVVWRGASGRQSKQSKLPHADSLPLALMSAMGRNLPLR